MATTSMLVNGSPTDEFPLGRGLRQGGLFHPFCFYCSRGFEYYDEAMVESYIFKGYSIGSDNPAVISHIQFADDTLLLGGKSWANARALRAILVLFEMVSRTFSLNL